MPADPAVEVCEDEKEEIDALLRDPQLLDKFIEDTNATGYVGEETGRKLILVAGVNTVFSCEPISITVKGNSSAGKNHLVNTVTRYFPKGTVLKFTNISAKAFGNMESEDMLKNKIVVIAESHGAEDALYALRTFQSEGEYSSLVSVKNENKGWKTEIRTARGPTGFIVTLTADAWHPENETRHFDYYMDESPEQTARILARQAQAFANVGTKQPDSEATVRRWQTAFSRLKQNITVMVPFAAELATKFPPTSLRARRDFPRLVHLTQASARLHMFQRQWADDKTIVATIDDYRNARQLVADSLGRSYVNSRLRRLFDWAKNQPGTFRRADYVNGVKVKDTAAKEDLRQATELGLLKPHGEPNDPGRSYSYVGMAALFPEL